MTSLPPTVPAPRLEQALARGADVRLLDVRTPAEFRGAYIAGSCNVPLHELERHAAEIASVGAPIVIVCRSGARARSAESLLKAAGASRIHVLDGGVLAWQAHGLPVEGEPMSAFAMIRAMFTGANDDATAEAVRRLASHRSGGVQ